MDFFDCQERARRESKRLLVLFTIAMLIKIGIVCLVLGSIVQIFLHAHASHHGGFFIEILNALALLFLDPAAYWKWLWNPALFGVIAAGTLASVALGSWLKMRRLSAKGGGAVAELLGGRRVDPASQDAHEQRLRDVVEEMAIASGTPVPELYLLDNERGINAFSAGSGRNDIAIGVTRGCVQSLERDELQGVVAHEFSHILNGDTRLNMELMGILHGMIWPVITGRVLIYGDARNYELDDRSIFDADMAGRLPQVFLGWLLVLGGSVGLPFARWIKSAICRQRELLADAAAVQFTRNPPGVAGALKKVGGLIKNGRLDTPHAETASHLYFASFQLAPWFNFLSSHPPLLQRIRALDPAFDGKFPFVHLLPPSRVERERQYEAAVSHSLQLHPVGQPASPTGQPTVEDIRAAGLIRMNLPLEISAATGTTAQACALIYALLIDSDEPVRSQQTALLQTRLAAADYEELTRLLPLLATVETRFRLPLIELSVPALRSLDPLAVETFLKTVRDLAEADRAIDLFEYALLRILQYRLAPARPGTMSSLAQITSTQALVSECRILLSALAWLGRENDAEVRASFREGCRYLDLRGTPPALLPHSECGLQQVDEALNRVNRAAPYVKRNILLACARAATAEKKIEVREMELLTAIADTLECPMPRFVEALENADDPAEPNVA